MTLDLLRSSPIFSNLPARYPLRVDVLDSLKYDERGLIPAVVQDADSNEVLMVAYMNKESLQKTIDTGLATYWSRSRQSFWVKGETSGHLQHVAQISVDCDVDTILLKVKQTGAACHENYRNCFFRDIKDGGLVLNGTPKLEG